MTISVTVVDAGWAASASVARTSVPGGSVRPEGRAPPAGLPVAPCSGALKADPIIPASASAAAWLPRLAVDTALRSQGARRDGPATGLLAAHRWSLPAYRARTCVVHRPLRRRGWTVPRPRRRPRRRMVRSMRYLALLRGVNVGGRTLIKMAALRACFEGLGFDRVSTYIASGNVLFDTAETG